MNESFIYAIQSKSGLIKIGTSQDPIGRLRALQTANGEDLRLVAAWQGGGYEEQSAHYELREHKARGEWFFPSKGVLDYLAAQDPNFQNPKEIITNLHNQELENWKDMAFGNKMLMFKGWMLSLILVWVLGAEMQEPIWWPKIYRKITGKEYVGELSLKDWYRDRLDKCHEDSNAFREKVFQDQLKQYEEQTKLYKTKGDK